MALVVGIDLGRKSAHDVAISDRRPVIRYNVGLGSHLATSTCGVGIWPKKSTVCVLGGGGLH